MHSVVLPVTVSNSAVNGIGTVVCCVCTLLSLSRSVSVLWRSVTCSTSAVMCRGNRFYSAEGELLHTHTRTHVYTQTQERAPLPFSLPAPPTSVLPPHKTVTLPALSPTMEVGSLVGWEKAEGELVEEGDVLARVETDKASMEMEAPHTGYVAKIVVPEGTRDIPLGKVGGAGGGVNG